MLSRKTPMKRNRPKSDSQFHPAARAEIERRSNRQCEVGTKFCTIKGEHIHHRLRRSQGGGGTVQNGLMCCRACHDWIHANPAIAYEKGWLLRSGIAQ